MCVHCNYCPCPSNDVTFIFDTTAEAEIGFNETEFTVQEGDTFTVCLVLTGGLQSPVDVNVTLVQGTAQGNTQTHVMVLTTIISKM